MTFESRLAGVHADLSGPARAGAGPGLAAEVAALAAAEQSCCAFFDFTLRLAPDALQLDVRAPAGAAEMPADLFGVSE
ncbi:hypothetical protein [Streptomyces malaysiensis]